MAEAVTAVSVADLTMGTSPPKRPTQASPIAPAMAVVWITLLSRTGPVADLTLQTPRSPSM